jgi:A/G-specific adenine glycosylase
VLVAMLGEVRVLAPRDCLEQPDEFGVVQWNRTRSARAMHARSSFSRDAPERRRVLYARRVKELLLAWFEANGRDLPWRHTKDPYAVLVSEVMLQQTQVERVIPRWRAWLAKWPTVESLAAASAGDVIVEWQGLGYNRRAVNLHRAAQHVFSHGWPDDLTALPGVGPYTAAAVANFAFGDDVLPVDVNIGRIRERTGEEFDGTCAQALFDLGATICLARIPRCGDCPLAARCPSRGRRYEPLRKQSRFEGSFRQRRANALRAVAAGEQVDDGDALVSLERDGLVELRGERAALPGR